MIHSRHTIATCGMCGDMVICADCGNNCCNATTGKVHGKECGCDEAYEHQTAYYRNKRSIEFAQDLRTKRQRTMKNPPR